MKVQTKKDDKETAPAFVTVDFYDQTIGKVNLPVVGNTGAGRPFTKKLLEYHIKNKTALSFSGMKE